MYRYLFVQIYQYLHKYNISFNGILWIHSDIARAELNEYKELANSELYEEIKLHLFSRISYTSQDMS